MPPSPLDLVRISPLVVLLKHLEAAQEAVVTALGMLDLPGQCDRVDGQWTVRLVYTDTDLDKLKVLLHKPRYHFAAFTPEVLTKMRETLGADWVGVDPNNGDIHVCFNLSRKEESP